ncbi:MAG: DUF4465 domain-containing protein [Patescibacteria group bacterium]|nr:DUF4465 domain-containing protein [Patescibacteria group bacterium]
MKRTMLTLVLSLALTASILLGAGEAFAQMATFDALPLSAGSYWNGSDKLVSGQYDPDHLMGPATFYSSGFSDGGVTLSNTFAEWWTSGGALWYTSWNGWAYSNITDTTTAGFTNEFSAYVLPGGGGHAGSANYALYYEGFDVETTVTGIPAGTLQGAYFTNTTYAALTMLNGDAYGFSKKFGGTTGSDPDWFLLTITGLNAANQSTGSVDFYLADYRFADAAEDYIVSDWTWVDLSSLGDATQLQFGFSSSDSGQWGMNTPAYFAMDSLTLGVIPEPSALLLLLCGGLVGLASFRRRAPRGR